ncbi:MAG: phosphonate C-P lyase system protein PhnG [Deltaproteobacteria bacterium]|jgi:alpha-D-ribose 1-methylphosphonate 5-triphosphate synthase subunit PhnG|nr:phosphonate C-P lyase system protein PhnG [Deltaproteobacteria bacterium]
MERQRIMRALALSRENTLIELMGSLGDIPPFEYLRRPQKGLIMVKARADAKNQAFNLGEALATRCSVNLNGKAGHAYVLGDEPEKCLAAALADALAQDERFRPEIERIALCLEADMARARALEVQKTQKTKVDFFTLVRGEDAD